MHLAWNDFQSSSVKTFRNLHNDENFTDVTLACPDGSQVKGHKVILSSSSPFFKNILLLNPHQHPLLVLKGVDIGALRSLMQFIYCGEVEIQNENLVKFLEAANELQIEGLQQREKQKREELHHISAQKENYNKEKKPGFQFETVPKEHLDNAKDPPKIKIEPAQESMEMIHDLSFETNNVGLNSESDEEEVFDSDIETKIGENSSMEISEDDHEDEAGDIDKSKTAIEQPFKQEPTTEGYDCEYCPASFTFEEQLEDHIEIEHDVKREDTVDENLSDKIVSEEPWNIEDSDPKTCKICDKVFANKWCVQEHTESVHDNTKFMCNYCDHMSTSRRNVRGHIRKKHPDNELPTTYTKIKSDPAEEQKKKPKPSKNVKNLAKLQPIEVPDLSKEKKDIKKETEAEKPRKPEKDAKKFKCNQCEKCPVSLPALRTHTWRAHPTTATLK